MADPRLFDPVLFTQNPVGPSFFAEPTPSEIEGSVQPRSRRVRRDSPSPTSSRELTVMDYFASPSPASPIFSLSSMPRELPNVEEYFASSIPSLPPSTAPSRPARSLSTTSSVRPRARPRVASPVLEEAFQAAPLVEVEAPVVAPAEVAVVPAVAPRPRARARRAAPREAAIPRGRGGGTSQSAESRKNVGVRNQKEFLRSLGARFPGQTPADIAEGIDKDRPGTQICPDSAFRTPCTKQPAKEQRAVVLPRPPPAAPVNVTGVPAMSPRQQRDRKRVTKRIEDEQLCERLMRALATDNAAGIVMHYEDLKRRKLLRRCAAGYKRDAALRARHGETLYKAYQRALRA